MIPEFHFNLIQILMDWLLQNFAHGMTAVLSCHVQNFAVIYYLEMELQQNEIPNDFGLSREFH